jgi:hypothetical protein
MAPEYTKEKARIFEISETEAKIMRTLYLKLRIEDFETRVKTAQKYYEEEETAVGKDILTDVIQEHTSQINRWKFELDQWQKPIKQYKAQQAPLDWSKASLYPCVDLMGNPSKKMGKEWIYKAPHREDKNPSFSVNVEKNIWHDWGTGQGGNVFDLYILLNGGSKVEACKAILNF